MPIIEIQGLKIRYRDLKKSFVTDDGELIEGEEILYYDLMQSEQYFRRVIPPFTDDEIVAIANKEHSYTDAQKKWVEKEKARMNYGGGVYAFINGEITYIPASYWGYINHWTLEDGTKPEYREDDRIFFLFMEYLCFETEVLGCVRGKGRRQGASTIGTFWLWWICGRLPEKKGGLISFNTESAQKIFQFMFMRGFKEMLPCFVEDFDSDSDNFIRFVKHIEKKKKGVPIKREGLNSYVDYLSTTINSYDSGSLSFGLFDETGKYEKMDINTYWSKVKPTLKKGRKKVGFAYMPTTVNPAKKGGENFKKFWGLANQNAINPSTGEPYGFNTPNQVVRYLVPATRGYAGCIDKFGKSIEADPIVPILDNEGKWITEGALTVIKRERELLTGEQHMEHRRDFPLDEHDMFAFQTGNCEFNEQAIIERIDYLKDHPEEAYWRQVRVYEEVDEKGKIIVKFADDPKGEIWLKEVPEQPNKYIDGYGLLHPDNTLMYQAGVDNYRSGFAINGSDGVITIFKKSIIINGEEQGLYPVCIFVGRPRSIWLFNRQVLLLCLWYGCKVNFEVDAGSFYYENFSEWRALKFLDWEPARDPTKQKKIIKPGTESANIFQLGKQLEVAKLYFDGNAIDHYNGNVHRNTFIPLLQQALEYIHSDREPFHLMVSLMMALLPCLNFSTKSKTQPPRKPVLPTFKLKMRQ